MNNEIIKREEKNRQTLANKKPYVWNKIQKFPEKIKNKESIALMQLQYDYRCNMKCEHCAIEDFRKNKKSMKLTIPDVQQIADQANNMGLASICISGGEPLIFPDLEDLISAIGPERFVISMDTNGLLLSEEKIKWLVDKGVDRIHLSIDGLKENHKNFRGNNDSWQKNIDALPFCTKHGLDVVINIVATRALVQSKEIEKQLAFIKEFGHHASMIYAKPVGTYKKHKDQVLNSEDLAYLETLTDKYNCSTHLTINNGNDIGCLCFKRHFSISAYGDVLPCPWIPISMGNVLTEGLETIINRGLSNKWFSWDCKHTCHSGNCDSEFYKKIIPQIDSFNEYPVDYRKINWHE